MRAPGEMLVERDAPLALIAGLLDRAREGDGGLLLVEGPAGIGKSRLLAHAVEQGASRGFTVLQARGGELERDVTFGVARQLFERLIYGLKGQEREHLLSGSAGLAVAALGVDPTGGGFSPETGPLHGLYWLVSNLAQRGPVALVVDDAHWADNESLRFLNYLVRRLAGLPVTIVVAARPREVDAESQLLDVLAGEAGDGHVTLGPLTAAGATTLFQARIGRALPATVADVCHEVTGGNPFFINEIAKALDAEGVDDPAAVVDRVRELVPPAVMLSILLRVGRGGPSARAVGVALAVLGSHATLELVGAVADLEPSVALSALERLADLGLATRTGDPALAHPIIRTAIYSDVPAARRRELHRLAAAALERRQAAVEDVAQHLLLTDPAGEDATATTLLHAGRRALARGAPETAVRLLARALAERAAHTPVQILMALAEAELATGATADAVTHLRAMVDEDLPPDVRARAALTLSRATAELDGERTAIIELRAARDRLDGDAALRVDVEQASLALYVAELVGDAKARLATYAHLPGTTPVERVALAVTSISRALDPDADAAEVVRIAERALATGTLVSEETSDSMVLQDVLHALQLAEQLDLHDAVVEQGFADARERGSAFGFFNLSLNALTAAGARGQTGPALAHGEAALRTLVDVPPRLVVKWWTISVRRFMTEALVQRGELDAARALLAADGDPGDQETRDYSLYSHGLIELAAGNAPAAAEHFLDYGAFCVRVGWEVRDSPWRRQAALALSAIGRHEQARELAAEGLAIAQRWGAPGGVGDAQRVVALVGDPAEAAERLADAVTSLRRSVMQLGLAEALIDRGVALRRDGQRIEAREVLLEGMDLAARCEAVPLAERARTELRVLGARPRRLAFSGVDSLTASERRVAELAGDGMTNREIAQALFVTPKTVEAHLGQVYRKLDIRSRTALPDALAVHTGE